MKIHVVSDIHLEMGALDQPVPSGDSLVLAGDITLLGPYDHDSDYYNNQRLIDRNEAFFSECAKNFEAVFYFPGNHEAYNSNISLAPALIRKHFGRHANLLDNKAVELGSGVVLFGATLWTDMFDGAAHDVFAPRGFGSPINDFNLIHVGKGNRRFTTRDCADRFRKAIKHLDAACETHRDKTIVVATHHAPSVKGISPAHTRSDYNAAYYSDLEAFIRERPMIRYWLHGHTHLQKTYRIGECQVFSNARGYHGREACAATFNFDCWFDPVTGKKSFKARGQM